MNNEIDTNQGQIIGTKHIKNFTTIDNLNENQYILAVSDELTGVGLKLSPRALSKTVISPVQGNGLIQDDDGLLYSNSAINKYDENITYNEGDWVLGSIAGIDKFYKSLQDDNIGNPLSDTDYWQPVSIGGGSGSAGLEIGYIGTALYVNESEGKKRKINGSILAINENTQGFVDWLETLQSTNPEYFTTESNWQAESALAIDGCVYKFVLDKDNATVRLPKYPDYIEINQGGTLPVVGNGMTLGLTNGSANVGLGAQNLNSDGGWRTAFSISPSSYGQAIGSAYNQSSAQSKTVFGVTTDPTNSGIETNLKQTKLKLYYFIQIATGSETQVNIINDIELNNPYTLFDSKYSDHQIFNASWLRSQGQYNPKAVYVKAYEALQVEYNSQVAVGSTVELPSGTQYTKQGLSVKLSTQTYNDYDFVLSTSDETFRLPIKSNLASGKAVVGNGMTLGLTDGTTNVGAWGGTNSIFNNHVSVYGTAVGTAINTQTNLGNKSIGITTDPTKSGIQLSDSNLYLYYYIGETVQNANLIDAGRIIETYATKQFATSASMPSDRYINLTLGASGTTYTAPANGYYAISIEAGATGAKYFYFHNERNALFSQSYTDGGAAYRLETFIPVKKNDVIKVGYNATGSYTFRFIYAEGEN